MDKTPDSNEIVKDFFSGLGFTSLLGILSLGLYGLYQLCITVGVWIVSVPISVAVLWLVGHILRGFHRDNRVRCGGGCGYRYGNIFTEWYHKRSCLPWLTKKV